MTDQEEKDRLLELARAHGRLENLKSPARIVMSNAHVPVTLRLGSKKRLLEQLLRENPALAGVTGILLLEIRELGRELRGLRRKVRDLQRDDQTLDDVFDTLQRIEEKLQEEDNR